MRIQLLIGFVCCIFWMGCGGEKTADEKEKTGTETGDVNGIKKKIVIPDGPYKEYYKGGELKIEGTMSGGEKEGEWKSYYPNGSSYSINNYGGGLLNGKTTTWYPNGQIRYIGYYTDGKPSGKWLIFNEKGEKLPDKEYK